RRRRRARTSSDSSATTSRRSWPTPRTRPQPPPASQPPVSAARAAGLSQYLWPMGDERRTTMQGDFAVVHLCEALASGIVKVVVPIANQTAAAGLATVVVHGRRPETPVELAAMFDPRVRLVGVRGWGERSPYSAFASSIRAAATLRRELSRHERGVLHMHSTYA